MTERQIEIYDIVDKFVETFLTIPHGTVVEMGCARVRLLDTFLQDVGVDIPGEDQEHDIFDRHMDYMYMIDDQTRVLSDCCLDRNQGRMIMFEVDDETGMQIFDLIVEGVRAELYELLCMYFFLPELTFDENEERRNAYVLK